VLTPRGSEVQVLYVPPDFIVALTSRLVAGQLVLLLCAAGVGCAARPVPHLERGIAALEEEHDRARGIADPVEQVRAYLALRTRTLEFRVELDGETELRPNARVRASSSHEAGIGWVSVDRRDVASVRARADRLVRSLDRFIASAAPVKLEGTGYTVADGELVRQGEAK
jgi:hypothetical protein